MMKQWKVDVITIVACASWLCSLVRKKAGLADYSPFNKKTKPAEKAETSTRDRRRPTLVDSTHNKARWLLGCDADAIKEIVKR